MQCLRSGKCNFTFDGIASANDDLKNSLAATPPETTKSEIFSWIEAFNTLLTMQSTAAFWKLFDISILSSSERLSNFWTAYKTAVFSPLKLKFRQSELIMGRGNLNLSI